jgi:cytochrome c-type biogenesis protein CcmH
MRRALLAILLLATILALPAAAVAAPPTLPDVEDEVMCATCRVPLNVAESPQADRERDFIRGLIAQGRSKEQIKQALVGEYGEDVLAMPRNRAATIIPVALGVGIVGLALLLLPRWRRRARTRASTPLAAGPSLSPADAARLDEDLRRYDG